MQNSMLAEALPIAAGSTASAPAKHAGKLDGRTRLARRAAELEAAFATDIGGTLTGTQRAACRRAGLLSAMAERLAERHLADDQTVSSDEVARMAGAARRAVLDLGIKASGKQQPGGPSAREWLAGRAARATVAQASAPNAKPPDMGGDLTQTGSESDPNRVTSEDVQPEGAAE